MKKDIFGKFTMKMSHFGKFTVDFWKITMKIRYFRKFTFYGNYFHGNTVV
jgi:hypothetical protein